jgi:hypothetical protein
MPGWRRVRNAVVLGLVAGPVLMACGGDDTPKTELGPKEWKASVFEAVLREVALPAAHDSMPDTEKPIVYLATADGSGISVEVQAIVARDLKDEADLRIEDDIADVVLEDEDLKPVRDDGLLVRVTPLPEDQPNQVELSVVLYVNEFDEDTIDVAMSRTDADWSVTTSIPAG